MKSLSCFLSEFEEFTYSSPYGKSLELTFLFISKQELDEFKKFLNLHGYESNGEFNTSFKKLHFKISCFIIHERVHTYLIGKYLYGVVFGSGVYSKMGMDDMFYIRTRVRSTDQYSCVHVASKINDEWKIEGF